MASDDFSGSRLAVWSVLYFGGMVLMCYSLSMNSGGARAGAAAMALMLAGVWVLVRGDEK